MTALQEDKHFKKTRKNMLHFTSRLTALIHDKIVVFDLAVFVRLKD